MRIALVLFIALVTSLAGAAQARPRGRELGIPFPGQTGKLNAITDVAGIAVGHVTLISGEGKIVPGKGPVRTGVTAILPRPRGNWDPVFAATFNQNGNGDMTGINWIKESGFMEGPILLTGTHSVGTVRDAAGAAAPSGTPALTMLPNDRIDPLFMATIDATEEAVVNAMLAAQTMTGADGIRVFGLPGDRVVAALKKYGRMK